MKALDELKKRWLLNGPPETPKCPACGCDEVSRIHHEATFAIPECDFWMCSECDEQWGHE